MSSPPRTEDQIAQFSAFNSFECGSGEDAASRFVTGMKVIEAFVVGSHSDDASAAAASHSESHVELGGAVAESRAKRPRSKSAHDAEDTSDENRAGPATHPDRAAHMGASGPATPQSRRLSAESGVFGSQPDSALRRDDKRPRIESSRVATGPSPPGRMFSDAIHGHFELDPICVAFIDTVQFQRLHNLKQLGVGNLVFPSASHNRFEHSVGTCYLAGRMVERLRDQQPELGITDVDVLCVKIAGLCHDLGHGPFSHTFEQHVRTHGDPRWSHEAASKAMFRHLITENELEPVLAERGLGPRDIDFIEELIAGAAPAEWLTPGGGPKGRPRDKSFLYEIVANKRNGVDVDKWDYFMRDSIHLNIKAPFDYQRYLLSVRVFQDADGLRQICPRDKEVDSVYDMWNARSRLHRNAYQHKTVKVLERMTLELFAMAEPHLLIPGTGGVLRKMSEAVTDMVAYTKLTDSILLLIDMSVDPALAPAQELLASIRCRKLYKFVGKAQPGADGDPARLSRAQLPYIRTEIAQRLPRSNGSGVSGLGVKEDDIVLDLIHISHGPGEDDPIHALRFWSKADPERMFKVSPDEVSHMLPAHCEVRQLCAYSKKPDAASKAAIAEAFLSWCSDNRFETTQIVASLVPSTPARRRDDEERCRRDPIPFDPNA